MRTSARLFAAVLLAAALGACAPSTAPRQDVPRPALPVVPDTVRIGSQGTIAVVPMEDYVLGTALAEIGPAGESPETTLAVFEVQSILARTYAASHLGRHKADGFDLCDTTHCQVYDPRRIATSRFSASARQAVEKTAGQVLTFNQRLTEALFHADCGGHTAAAQTVWGSAVPYLIGTPDPAVEKTHRHWQYRATRAQLRDALNVSAQSAVGQMLTSITVVERDASGRAARVEVAGENVRLLRGEQIRAVLNQTFGYRAILSSRFTVTESDDEFLFDGTGFGHGVGLCQVGATARLRRGESLEAVMSAYFPGSQVTRSTRPRPAAFPTR